MKKFIIVMLVMFGVILSGNVQAQKKSKYKLKSTSSKTRSKIAKVKFTPKEFGTPAAITDLKDENETNPEYQSLKNLIETNGVTIAYADSTFMPKEPLRRGDFIVSFNSALQSIKKVTDANGLE